MLVGCRTRSNWCPWPIGPKLIFATGPILAWGLSSSWLRLQSTPPLPKSAPRQKELRRSPLRFSDYLFLPKKNDRAVRVASAIAQFVPRSLAVVLQLPNHQNDRHREMVRCVELATTESKCSCCWGLACWLPSSIWQLAGIGRRRLPNLQPLANSWGISRYLSVLVRPKLGLHPRNFVASKIDPTARVRGQTWGDAARFLAAFFHIRRLPANRIGLARSPDARDGHLGCDPSRWRSSFRRIAVKNFP